ncbi:hypothetical protein SAMN02745126_00953 [Enhydrobacter aerosaccus]|uniref:Uncharacterized protein n=1 Tax=Enhydrobacter aerosaccus TaxID=225324 RepID=A0A1T4KGI3_9HYPH|nr:hypothetical protein [Enhydrobacter aerosaccus]SJZ41467.1 hypothetical protein SAMN02745126_00953 [Enhydrobacter aerosaccus]
MALIDQFSPTAWQAFYERHPNAVLWLVGAVQVAAMLALGVLLRWLLA